MSEGTQRPQSSMCKHHDQGQPYGEREPLKSVQSSSFFLMRPSSRLIKELASAPRENVAIESCRVIDKDEEVYCLSDPHIGPLNRSVSADHLS